MAASLPRSYYIVMMPYNIIMFGKERIAIHRLSCQSALPATKIFCNHLASLLALHMYIAS